MQKKKKGTKIAPVKHRQGTQQHRPELPINSLRVLILCKRSRPKSCSRLREVCGRLTLASSMTILSVSSEGEVACLGKTGSVAGDVGTVKVAGVCSRCVREREMLPAPAEARILDVLLK